MLHFLRGGNQTGITDWSRIRLFCNIFSRCHDCCEDRILLVVNVVVDVAQKLFQPLNVYFSLLEM